MICRPNGYMLYFDLRQTYLALKQKFLRGRGYETYNKKVQKQHEEKTNADEEATVEEDEEAPVHLVTHVNNILHSFFSNVEAYINNQQVCNTYGLYPNKSHFTNNFKRAKTEYKRVLLCEGYDYEEFPDKILESPLFEPVFTRRMKLLSRPDGFMLYGKLGTDFFSSSELLYPNTKIRLRLIRARPNFYMITENPNFSLRIFDCWL